jgi:hypothetical protein
VLKSIFSSPSFRVAIAFAFGGAGFAGGNLILARALTAQQYGLVTLVIGLFSVASQIAPLGIDLVLTRSGLKLGTHLRHAVLLASAVSALVTAGVGVVFYKLTLPLAACLFWSVAGAGMSQSAAAHFQSEKQFRASVPLLQAFNWALIPIGVATIVTGDATAVLPCVLMAVASVTAGIAGWVWVIRKDPPSESRMTRVLWRQAFSLVTLLAAVAIFLNLERLVLPAAVGMADLALFGVLAALVGSPYRVIQAAVSFTVLPRLRDAKSAQQRRHLLWHEALVWTAVLLPGTVAVWFVAPLLAQWLLSGRYVLTAGPMAATLLSGILRVIAAGATATVTAVAPESGVQLLSTGSWLCMAVAVAASFLAARWGLTGVIYAVALGWFLRCCLAAGIALPYLNSMPPVARGGDQLTPLP